MEETKNRTCEINNKRSFLLFFTLLAAFILKYLIYGFNYFPILDDYIQYGGYPMYNDLSHVLFNIGTIASRPLASFLDVVFWGNLWKAKHIMLIFSCAFHFLSCVFFYKAARENNLHFTPLFAVFYLFFPLGSEGSLWISASSRIVVGLFFVSLTVLMLTKYQAQGKARFYIAFLLCGACSFCLYETCAVFCFLVCVMVLINYREKKRYILPLSSLCALLFGLLLYMKLGQNIGAMGTRAGESSVFLIFSQLGDFFSQLFEILIKGAYRLTIDGFTSGLFVLFKKGIVGILYLFAIFIVCSIYGKLFSKTQTQQISKNKTIFLIISGALLFFGPFAPNLISSPVWITHRTMFVPLIGLYLIFDLLFSKIKNKSVQTILIMVLLFMFTASSVNEYDTFKRTNELDAKLLDTICSSLPESVLSGEMEVAVLLDEAPATPQVCYYKDHIKTVFSEDWSLTGAVRAHMENIKIKRVVPIYSDSEFDYTNCFVIDLRKKE